MLTLSLELEQPSFTDPALLGNVHWLRDGQVIQVGPERTQLQSFELGAL
jgi:hypothetical protein